MALFVKFYGRPVFNAFQSDKQGRPIHDMVDFCRIEIPGVVANVVDDPATDHQKIEHSVEWHRYLNEKETGIESEHSGTMLSAWPQLNAAQVLEMKHFKFYTVEHVAEAGDAQLQAIGMAAGMSPYSLRDKAKAWLENARGTAANAADKKRDDEIAELKALVKSLTEKKKPGRPKKVAETA